MGAYSTVSISRERAISEIIDKLDEATDEEISAALFALTSDHTLDNYDVFSKEEIGSDAAPPFIGN